MKYLGSKRRIAKDIVNIILDDTKGDGVVNFYEPFMGGLHLSQELLNTLPKDRVGHFVASDKNFYLTAMWQVLKTDGVDYFPRNFDKEYYVKYREIYHKINRGIQANDVEQDLYLNANIGWVAFMGSQKGRGFSGGFSGKTKTRDYIDESVRNIEKQINQGEWLNKVDIIYDNKVGYEMGLDCLTKDKYIVYCDIPYKDTVQYEATKDFNYNKFYDWCVNMSKNGHSVYVSEYDIPDNRFECVWSKELTCSLETNTTHKKTEKLYKVKHND